MAKRIAAIFAFQGASTLSPDNSPARDFLAILDSEGAMHDLSEIDRHWQSALTPEWVIDFQVWLALTVESANTEELSYYPELVTHAPRNHLSVEHFLPLITAARTRGPNVAGRSIHRSRTFGTFATGAHYFD